MTKIKTELINDIQPELLVQNLNLTSCSGSDDNNYKPGFSDEEEDDIPIGRLIKLKTQGKSCSKSKEKSIISDISKKT